MRRSLLVLVLLASTLLTAAQEKLKELTLKDAITKAATDFRPEHMDGLQWIPGTEQYSFVKDNTLMRGGTGKMADLPIVTVDQLNAQLPKDKTLKNFPDIEWEGQDQFTFQHQNEIWLYVVGKSTLFGRMPVDPNAERVDVDATKHAMAYTLAEDLYVRTLSPNDPLRATSDGADGIVNGRSVHREEYGITKGTFWNPTGTKLAFYRMDESMVTPYSLEDISTQPSTFKKIRYPMAGQTSHQVKLGVFDVASNRTTFMKTTGAPDDYLTNISWDPPGTHVFIIHLNRAT